MKIDIEELMGAFEEHFEFGRWSFNVRTGELRPPELESESLAEEESEETAEGEDWVYVPTIESREAYDWMVECAGSVEDLTLGRLLEVALNGRGAFRRFKDVLYGFSEEQERWYEFHNSLLRQEVIEWLEGLGIQAEDVHGAENAR